MKKKLLSLAIAGASLVAANSYAAGPTVYGKLNVSLQKVDVEVDNEDLQDTWKLMSNASRMGITGDADINSNLKAIYKLEYELSVDGDDDEFRQRNIYAGLQGKSWGTLLAGKHDSPLKISQGKADQFNDMYGADIKYLMVGENRPNDTIMYSTPNMGGFMLTAAIMPGEQTDAEGSDDDADDGIADYMSVAAELKIDALRLALAYDSDIANNDVIRLTGEFVADAFEIGVIYQMAEAADENINEDDLDTDDLYLDDNLVLKSLLDDGEQDAWVVSGAFKPNDKLKLKAQVGMSTTESDFLPVDENGSGLLVVAGGENEVTLIALGVDYSLAASTTVFGYYAKLDAELDGDNFQTTLDGDLTTFGVGIDHKF